jgi:D-3-phosphoglycerate dehydrogenase
MKVLVADKFEDSGLEALNKLGVEVLYEPSLSSDGLGERLRESGSEVLVVRSTRVEASAIQDTNLGLIVRAGAGVNTIDVKTASSRGVFVTNCPGKNSVAVAELVFGLLLAIDRRIAESVASLRSHKWNKKEFSKADGLMGKTLGVVGTGQIGREVIRRAQAFGLPVIAWSRSLTDAEAEGLGVERCAELNEVFRRADIVSLHVALKPETKRLANAERLAMM